MFRKITATVFAILLAGSGLARATVVGPLPFNLTNGSVADASQVMANFNKIVNDVNTNVIFPSFTQQNYYAADTGTANNVIVSLSPTPSLYVPGMVVNVKVAASNTGATVINANGLGNQSVVNLDGSPLNSQQLLAGEVAQLVYDGTQFQLTSLTPLALRQATISRTVFLDTTPGAWTFTVPAGVYSVKLQAWGGGGGGGGTPTNSNAAGAGGGAYGMAYLSVVPGDVLSGQIGAAGTGGASNTNGVAGGNTTVLKNGTSFGTAGGGAFSIGLASGVSQAGGLGGSATGSWLIALTGQTGSAGLPSGSYGGPGGNSPLGGVGGGGGGGGGGNPGGGGGGGGSSAGGAGGVGWIYIEY